MKEGGGRIVRKKFLRKGRANKIFEEGGGGLENIVRWNFVLVNKFGQDREKHFQENFGRALKAK